MMIKVETILAAVPVLTGLINRECPMAIKGRYRVARMYAKLKVEFDTVQERRDAMIKAYDTKQQIPDPTFVATSEGEPPRMIDGSNFMVPEDKLVEFNAAFKQITDEMVDVEIDPIPLVYLEANPPEAGIKAGELVLLGDLVKE